MMVDQLLDRLFRDFVSKDAVERTGRVTGTICREEVVVDEKGPVDTTVATEDWPKASGR